jgi:replicative DNA helicase
MSYNAGVIPPNVTDFERLVIGTLMIDSFGLNKGVSLLGNDSQVFYDPRHQEIYKSILQLKERNKPVDLATIIFDLKNRKSLDSAGGDNYLIELTMGISSSAHLEFHCYTVLEKFLARKIIEIGNFIVKKSYESTDVFEVLDNFQTEINKIHDIISGKKAIRTAKDLHQELIENLKEGLARGVKIPFKKMDDSFFGWQNSDLVIVGARPGMGKSAYALELARAAAKDSSAVLFFSLEMANIQLHKRLVSNELGIYSDRLRKHQLQEMDWQSLYQCKNIEEMPLYYEDSVFNINDLMSRSRVIKKEKNIKIIIVDYLQLIEAKGKSEGNEKVSYISRKLKMLAKELNVPVIALSQLSRKCEERRIQRPILSDLRDSGAIEQDADVIQFLYRPEYYGHEKWDCEWNEGSDLPTTGEAEIFTAKHRHCGSSNTRLNWNPQFQRFSDLNSGFSEPQQLPKINTETAFDDQDNTPF